MARVVISIAAMVIFGLIGASPAGAATVTLKVGNNVGSVFDTAGRLISRHLGEFLPGKPEIVVENVDGGGGLLLVRKIENSEPTDGSVIGLINNGLISVSILTPEKAPFDPSKLSWIGSIGLVPTVCAVTLRSGINTMADLATADAKMGAGRSAKLYTLEAMIKHLYGAKFQIIQGFDGIAEIKLAMERGEIDGVCGVTLNTFIALGFSDTAKLIGTFDEGVVYDGIPVPNLLPADLSEADRKAVALLVKDEQVFAPLMMPGTADPAVVAEYRAAYDKMVADPAFQADAAKDFPNLHPTTGAQVEALVQELAQSDAATIARAQELAQ